MKLSLHRETLQVLTPEAAAIPAGGGVFTTDATYSPACVTARTCLTATPGCFTVGCPPSGGGQSGGRYICTQPQ